MLALSLETRIALAGFALAALAYTLTRLDGPKNAILSWRMWMASHDMDAETGKQKLGVGDLLDCPFCLSVWIAPAVAMFVIFPNPVFDVLLVLGGMLGIAYAVIGLTSASSL